MFRLEMLLIAIACLLAWLLPPQPRRRPGQAKPGKPREQWRRWHRDDRKRIRRNRGLRQIGAPWRYLPRRRVEVD